MAVSALAISVVIRNSTIEVRYPGGMAAFARSCPNRTYCTDGSISRVGFMVQSDAETFINRLRAADLTLSPEEFPSQIAVTVQGHGFLTPCDWLQLGLFDGHPSVWLAGADCGELYFPQGQLNCNVTTLTAEELRRDFELVGSTDGTEVYRHKATGEMRYVGRAFGPVRKQWQFWKRWRKPSINTGNYEQICRAAYEFVRPYIEYQLGGGPPGTFDRRQLKRGCGLLSRLLQFNPNDWKTLWLRGIAHKYLQELAPAYNDFRRAHVIEQTSPHSGRELAGVCIALGKGEEAVRVCRELMQKWPTDAGLISNYALALLIAGNVQEAEAEVQESLRLDSEDHVTSTLAKLISEVRASRLPIPDRWPCPSWKR